MRIVSFIVLLFLLSSCGNSVPDRDQIDVLGFYEVEKVVISGDSRVSKTKILLDRMGIENNYEDEPQEQSKVYYAINTKGEHVFITSPYNEKYNTYSVPFPFPKLDQIVTEVLAFNENNDIKNIEDYSDIKLSKRGYSHIRFINDDFSSETPYNFIMTIGTIYTNTNPPASTYVYVYAISETEFAFIHDIDANYTIIWEFTID